MTLPERLAGIVMDDIALGEAIAALEEYGLAGGDAVLVKGSNSIGLGRLVTHLVDRGR